jgi:hypothetical protein
MADSLGLATLIVAVGAIALTVSPVSLNFIASIYAAVLSTIWPPLARCERLEWLDILDGPLHSCSLPPQHCTHLGPPDVEQTWEKTIASFFTIRRGNTVRKPKQLSPTTTYIRTDTTTLKVLLSLLNVGEEAVRVIFQEVEGLLTAYIQLRRPLPTNFRRPYRLDVTKREMELILQGYPPWYQNPLSLPDNRYIPHPILDPSDLSRGGWIVAVGLSPTVPVAPDFMDRDSDGRVVIVDRALDRMVHCLENLEKAFPGDQSVSIAHKLMQDVRSIRRFGYSGSHLNALFRHSNFEQGRQRWYAFRESTEGLTNQQISTAMQVFSRYAPPTNDEITELRPVLKTVFRAALVGTHQVLSHLYIADGRPQPYVLPPDLTKDGLVYVRERWPSLED